MSLSEGLSLIDPGLPQELRAYELEREITASRIEYLARRNQGLSFDSSVDSFPPRIRELCLEAGFPPGGDKTVRVDYKVDSNRNPYVGSWFQIINDSVGAEGINLWRVTPNLGLVEGIAPYLDLDVCAYTSRDVEWLKIQEQATAPTQLAANRVLRAGRPHFTTYHLGLLKEFADLVDGELVRQGEKPSTTLLDEAVKLIEQYSTSSTNHSP